VPPRHVALAVLVALAWGVNFVVIHEGLQTLPPLLFAALRFTLVAFPAVFLVGRPRVGASWVVAIGLTLSAGQFGLLFCAMDAGMPAGLASLVIQLQAVGTIGLAVALLGERPSRAQLAGALVALAGLAVIAVGRAEGVPLGALALTVAAACSWAVGNVCTRVVRPPDAVALLVWSSLVAPLPLLALSFAVEGPGAAATALGQADLGAALAVLYVVVVASGFGFGAWTWLLGRHEASRVVPYALLVPVAGIASAWLALGETPTGGELAGGSVVLVGLALTTGALRAPRRRATAPPPAQAWAEGG
jgi:O-acetylserine/cysteine efflux transporter